MQSYKSLLETYHELNGCHIPTLSSAPTAMEFLRLAARNRPFMIRGGAADWPAVQKWDKAYLLAAMGGKEVRVAVTPLGNADAPVLQERMSMTKTLSENTAVGEGADSIEQQQQDDDDENENENEKSRWIFVQPAEEIKPFSVFLEGISRTSQSDSQSGPGSLFEGPVEYAQSQNDNLRSEYLPLFPDVASDIDWARIALQQDPEAINIWIGNERSTTALHKDNYENIYVQIIGQKHFVILPPIEAPAVNDVFMHQGIYQRVIGDDSGEKWHIKDLLDAGQIPVAVWDPDVPQQRTTKYSHLSRPLRITLEPGDMFYLPSTWYHKVTQSCGPEGICVAVNYWYDMDFEGFFHPTTTFVREVMAEFDQLNS